MSQLTDFIPKTIGECQALLKDLDGNRDGIAIADRYGRIDALNPTEIKALIELIKKQIGIEAPSTPDGNGVVTDKGILFWLGNKDLKKGMEVFVDDENHEGLIPAPDGKYTTERGTVISVSEGIATSVARPASKKSNPKSIKK